MNSCRRFTTLGSGPFLSKIVSTRVTCKALVFLHNWHHFCRQPGGLTRIFSFVIARTYTLILVILAGILLSFWRFSIFKNEQFKVAEFVGSEILLTGKIAEDPDLNQEKGEISLKIDILEILV